VKLTQHRHIHLEFKVKEGLQTAIQQVFSEGQKFG